MLLHVGMKVMRYQSYMGMSTNHETEEVYMVSIYDFTVRDREVKDV